MTLKGAILKSLGLSALNMLVVSFIIWGITQGNESPAMLIGLRFLMPAVIFMTSFVGIFNFMSNKVK